MPPSPVVASGSDSTVPTATEQSKDPRRACIPPRQPNPTQNIAKLLQDFSSQIRATASLEADREHVAKKIRLDEKAKSKAEKRQFQFPALQRERGYDTTLASVEQKLQHQMKMQEQLTETLASSLCHASEASLIESIKRGETELVSPEFKQELGEMKESIASQATDIKNMSGQLNTLNVGLDSTERSIHNLTNSNPVLKLEESLHKLEDNCKENDDATCRRIEELRQEIKVQKSLNDNTLKTRSGLEEKPAPGPLEASTSDEVKFLQSDIKSLSDQFQNLRDVQETKDNLVTEEVDRAQSSIQEFKGNLSQLLETTTRLQREINDSRSSNATQSAEVQQRFGHVSEWIKTLSESREAHSTALHSLQTRYNNISTEHVVSRMAAEMHGMYPFAANAQREFQNIYTQIGQMRTSTSTLSNQVESLGAAQNAPDPSKAWVETQEKEIKDEMERLGQELKTHGEKITAVEEKISTAHTDSLDKLASAKEKVAEDLGALKEDMGDIEHVTSEQLASTMRKMERLEESMSTMKATIRKISKKAPQAHGGNTEANGRISVEGSPRQTSDSSSESRGPPEDFKASKLRNVSMASDPLQSKSDSGQSPAPKGKQIATLSTTPTPKKRKRNSSSLHRAHR